MSTYSSDPASLHCQNIFHLVSYMADEDGLDDRATAAEAENPDACFLDVITSKRVGGGNGGCHGIRLMLLCAIEPYIQNVLEVVP